MGDIYLYIVLGSVFSTVFLIVVFSGLPAVAKNRPKRSMDKLSYYQITPQSQAKEQLSFFERTAMPLFSKIGGLVKRLSPANIAESTKHKLELAGMYEKVSVDMYLAVKFMFPIGFFFFAIIMLVFFPLPGLLVFAVLALIPISYFFPEVYVRRRARARQDEIKKALPNALDLLTISVEAGMGFDGALAKVAQNIRGSLGEELNKMLRELQLGYSRKEAFRSLNRRTEVADLNTFIVSMIQAETFGISIGKVLRVQASEMRTRRRQRAEEEGVKAPVKLVFPVILCLFPALMTVIIGPAVIRVIGLLMDMAGS